MPCSQGKRRAIPSSHTKSNLERVSQMSHSKLCQCLELFQSFMTAKHIFIASEILSICTVNHPWLLIKKKNKYKHTKSPMKLAPCTPRNLENWSDLSRTGLPGRCSMRTRACPSPWVCPCEYTSSSIRKWVLDPMRIDQCNLGTCPLPLCEFCPGAYLRCGHFVQVHTACEDTRSRKGSGKKRAVGLGTTPASGPIGYDRLAHSGSLWPLLCQQDCIC